MGHPGYFLLGVLLTVVLDVVLRVVERVRKRRKEAALKAADPWLIGPGDIVTGTTDREPSLPPSSQDVATMSRVRYGTNRPGRNGVRGKRPN